MTFRPFPSIDQFRNVIRSVGLRSAYTGVDAAGEPQYDGTKPKPKLRFRGTVKIHGTNAGINLTLGDGVVLATAQSRSREMTEPGDDNAGFRAFVDKLPQKVLTTLWADAVGATEALHDSVTIFGEWAGRGIQKGVAVNELEKFFYVFAVAAGPIDKPVWGDVATFRSGPKDKRDEMGMFCVPSARIYCAVDPGKFPVYEREIDFAHPELVQNDLVALTVAVEDECPVGRVFGVKGVGEGIVWQCLTEGYRDQLFKVKGEKHSASKVKTLAAVDVEKVQSIQEFVDKVVTEQRLEQGLQVLREAGKPVDQTTTGDFLRWIVGDVLKEESDTMTESGIDPKDVGKYVNQKARTWFFARF